MLLFHEPVKINVISAGRLEPLLHSFSFIITSAEWSPRRLLIQATELLPSGLYPGKTHGIIIDF